MKHQACPLQDNSYLTNEKITVGHMQYTEIFCDLSHLMLKVSREIWFGGGS